MKEHITKNRAKQFVCGHCNEVCSEEPCEPSDCDWMAFIDKEPAADVVEVRHGDWILRHVGAGHYWECSVCHENPCIYVTKNTKFCPNCGALMDKEE